MGGVGRRIDVKTCDKGRVCSTCFLIESDRGRVLVMDPQSFMHVALYLFLAIWLTPHNYSWLTQNENLYDTIRLKLRLKS